ncbi:MAG: gamma-glutamyltransferase [Candidatus Thorarchaeota archaeon]|jgi:gamma-glutamyltranspeptidase/glutathione hydrolase
MSQEFSGRSDVFAKNGMVATSQPLATQAGIRILQSGGNAVDAAVAAAAVLDVVEPFSTGCGGDAFALIHNPGAKKPLSFNGSGRAGSLVSLEDLKEKGWTEMPLLGGAPVTVPGAIHLWFHLVEQQGSLEMSEVLTDAIQYAREGFPVSPIIARYWAGIIDRLQNDAARDIFTANGQAPLMGDKMRNKDLASVLERLSKEGVDAFYEGDIAEAIVNTVQKHGGFLTMEDMKSHRSLRTDPISTDYRGFRVFEHPPNSQGFAALEMLNLMEEYNISGYDSWAVERFHIMIEAKKLAYADLHQHCADPEFYNVPIAQLLSKEYSKTRAELIKMNEASESFSTGIPLGQDTVYLCAADNEGRAVSFINSLYIGFGSGLVVPDTGIKLQNRGNLFSLNPTHPNRYEPGKLPFHTIIPGALYEESHFHGVFGIMGGAHQAQAHAQFVSNIVDYDMSPQQAIDHPRFNHNQGPNTVAIEAGVPQTVQIELLRIGHTIVESPMTTFGGGQAILRNCDAWIAGSDHRKDGMAVGF